jgi:hypothetical protein
MLHWVWKHSGINARGHCGHSIKNYSKIKKYKNKKKLARRMLPNTW